jgi:predicted nucleic acid-binding protein
VRSRAASARCGSRASACFARTAGVEDGRRRKRGLKWYFDEPGASAADRLLAEFAAGDRELLAPDLIVAEFGNALWKRIRRGECDLAAAGSILALWEGEHPPLVPGSMVAAHALSLAVELDHPVYDCLYLATALAFDAGFATADRALARAARGPLAEVLLIAD